MRDRGFNDNLTFVFWCACSTNGFENRDTALVLYTLLSCHCRCFLFIMLVSAKCNEG